MAAPSASPPPSTLHQYPLTFSGGGAGGDEEEGSGSSGSASNAIFRDVSLFTALYWLLPLYVLAGWLDRTDPAVAEAIRQIREWNTAKVGTERSAATDMPLDVRVTLMLLPLYESFFEEKSRRVPQSEQQYRSTKSMQIPTPKGAKLITREKVEGNESPARPDFLRVSATAAADANKELGYFCLWPGHDHFLVHYEDPKEKLRHFTYVQLDRLRFAYVAMKELLDGDGKVFHRHDGSITGLASRDIKKNCKKEGTSDKGDQTIASPTIPTVGRGGGNARLHHGTSGNVITAPSTAVVEAKKEAQQKRFLRDELQNLCLARWPHTPIQKSCVFTIADQRQQCALDGTEEIGGGLATMNVTNRNGTKRKGPTFYLGAVDLPLFNKKGGSARFKARKWWSVKADAEADAAEVALQALQNTK